MLVPSDAANLTKRRVLVYVVSDSYSSLANLTERSVLVCSIVASFSPLSL